MFSRQRRHNSVEMQLAGGVTVRGVLIVSPRSKAGHYVLYSPKVVTGEQSTESLVGHMEIPREQVVFYLVTG